MKKPEEIYKEAKLIVLNDGNQSLNTISFISIEIAQKNMFRFLSNESEKNENKNLSLCEFFDKMERKLF